MKQSGLLFVLLLALTLSTSTARVKKGKSSSSYTKGKKAGKLAVEGIWDDYDGCENIDDLEDDALDLLRPTCKGKRDKRDALECLYDKGWNQGVKDAIDNIRDDCEALTEEDCEDIGLSTAEYVADQNAKTYCPDRKEKNGSTFNSKPEEICRDESIDTCRNVVLDKLLDICGKELKLTREEKYDLKNECDEEIEAIFN